MSTLVCAPPDPETFEAVTRWIKKNPPRSFPVKELKNCKVTIRRRRTAAGVSYAVITITVDKWGSLRFLSFDSDGYIVIKGYGNEQPIKTPLAAFLDGPGESGDCRICGQRRLLLQECNSNGTPRGDVRCKGCYHLPSDIDEAPLVSPS